MRCIGSESSEYAQWNYISYQEEWGALNYSTVVQQLQDVQGANRMLMDLAEVRGSEIEALKQQVQDLKQQVQGLARQYDQEITSIKQNIHSLVAKMHEPWVVVACFTIPALWVVSTLGDYVLKQD